MRRVPFKRQVGQSQSLASELDNALLRLSWQWQQQKAGIDAGHTTPVRHSQVQSFIDIHPLHPTMTNEDRQGACMSLLASTISDDASPLDGHQAAAIVGQKYSKLACLRV